MANGRALRLIEAAEKAAQGGSFTRAVSLFKTAVRLDPNLPTAYLYLADLYLALAMEREAERAARECLTRAVAAGDLKTASAAMAFLYSLSNPSDPV